VVMGIKQKPMSFFKMNPILGVVADYSTRASPMPLGSDAAVTVFVLRSQ